MPYSNHIHQLSLRRAKHRTSGLGCISGTVQSTWAMLTLLLAIANLTNLIIATSVSVAVLHAIIIVENYCILAAVRTQDSECPLSTRGPARSRTADVYATLGGGDRQHTSRTPTAASFDDHVQPVVAGGVLYIVRCTFGKS